MPPLALSRNDRAGSASAERQSRDDTSTPAALPLDLVLFFSCLLGNPGNAATAADGRDVQLTEFGVLLRAEFKEGGASTAPFHRGQELKE